MFFTAFLGIVCIGLSYTKAFTKEVELPDGTTGYFINYYANNTIFYFKLITAL